MALYNTKHNLTIISKDEIRLNGRLFLSADSIKENNKEIKDDFKAIYEILDNLIPLNLANELEKS